MTQTLKANMITIGLVEGVAHACMLMAKVFSGILSDYRRQRKSLTVLGYGLATLSKILFPLSTGMGLVSAAHIMDRIGKGIA